MAAIVAYKAVWEADAPYYAAALSASAYCEPVAVGGTLSLQATVSGFEGYTPAYQWQVSSDGETFASVSGATSEVYEKTATSSDIGKYYRVVVTASCGTATSEAVQVEEEE